MNELFEELFEKMPLEDKKKIVEKLMGNELKTGREDIEENKEKIINNVMQMLDDAFCFVGVTNKGITMIGADTCILTCMDLIIREMVKGGVPKKMILQSVGKALEGVEDE